jgi:hypothetical protein
MRNGSAEKKPDCLRKRPYRHGCSVLTISTESLSPDLQNEFVGAVIGAMASSEDLSTQILNNPELSQKLLGELVPIVYKGLKAAG